MSNIEEPDVDEAEEVVQVDTASAGPIGKVTGYPPGNPHHISPGEAALRKEEEAKFGKATAATRAWARANEHRAKKGGGNPKHQARPGGSNAGGPGGRGAKARPDQATNFGDVPLSASVKEAAKGRPKAETKMWAARVQLGSAIICAKLQRPNMVLTEDEAQLATEAVMDLFDFYGLLNKKKLGPWGNVAYAALIISAPRIGQLVMERMAQNKAPAPVQQNQQ